ncbi:AraC family transcriptional regulator [Chryseobacterium sp. C-71]|uniref:helix-turn-helix domain-containing protein n=1 Tax=Chryseobacterium sp. C-71 TaxID=2893882 RepID=UPI001E4509E3|nr:AraC family transcriptional regulator [Chryseobacterium sp. C-71]UFH33183.1 AraC family transcriptional regulator [Chryseobacterium sp. C-71]
MFLSRTQVKYYLENYTFLKDSIAIVDKSNADKIVKKLLTEANNKHQEDYNKQLIYMVTFLAIVSIAMIFFCMWRNKFLNKNYGQLRNEFENNKVFIQNDTEIDKNNTSDDSRQTLNKNRINTETETRILNELKAFENSEAFLERDLTTTVIANLLNTNPKYLSEIIKKNREQTFSEYINNLKIDYIVYKLYNEPKYRDYKISYLAEVCGYSSVQVFAIAFKKVHGVTPSDFLRKLKE